MELKIYHPFPSSTISQGFGANGNASYKADGLLGHTGRDYAVEWGLPIPQCLENAQVYSTIHRDDPNLLNYRSVFTIWDDPDSDTSYELSYGHCSDISTRVLYTPKVGDTIANIGNTGGVYTNGVQVTEAEKAAGSHAGAHLHFQLRKCKRVAKTDGVSKLLQDGNGVLIRNGMYYEIVDFQNGFNGCIDPTPFMSPILATQVTQYIDLNQNLITLLKQMVGLLIKKLN